LYKKDQETVNYRLKLRARMYWALIALHPLYSINKEVLE